MGQAPVNGRVVSEVDGRLAHVQRGDRDRRGDRSLLHPHGVLLDTIPFVPGRGNHGHDEFVEVGVRVDRGLEGPVVRGVRVLRETPELVDPPRGDLFMAEVVALLAGDDQPGFHGQEQWKVLALRQQRTEGVDHAAVIRIVQWPAEPLLHALQGQLLSRCVQPAKQERARSAVEAELEGGLVVDHEQAPPRPAAELLQFRAEVQPRLGGRDAESAGVTRSDHHGPTLREAVRRLHRVPSTECRSPAPPSDSYARSACDDPARAPEHRGRLQLLLHAQQVTRG